MLVWQIGENASFDPSVLKLNRNFTTVSPLQPTALAVSAFGMFELFSAQIHTT
jgi:hypothetical protein